MMIKPIYLSVLVSFLVASVCLAAAGPEPQQHSDGQVGVTVVGREDPFATLAEKNKPAAVFDPDAGAYVETGGFRAKCDERLGALPSSWRPWKVVNFSKDKKDAMLDDYFSELNKLSTPGAELAKRHNARSNEIGCNLVADGVADSVDDVNRVMLTGFYHAYGPVNDYLK